MHCGIALVIFVSGRKRRRKSLGMKKEVLKWYCKGCGCWHTLEELDYDRNGARVCSVKHTRVKTKPRTVLMEVIA